ncbi:hypothetical protein GCM10010151_07600 [Actinoallomurus spadix]|uniref:Aminoglycoside phosphotransferase domain-containing protein n=1 Tax=Actinoallomurus spadix TaxID=79912 RepID=A0ABN0VYC1_9ACTN
MPSDPLTRSTASWDHVKARHTGWAVAGRGVQEAADLLAHGPHGADAFCRGVGGERWFGTDDLGRALFEGDRPHGHPGFVGLRDALLTELEPAVNRLRLMAAALAGAGEHYHTTEQALAGELRRLLGARPPGTRSPGRARPPEPYRLPHPSDGLPASAPPPDAWVRAETVLGWLGVPCQWPSGDPDGLRRLGAAAESLKKVIEDVAAQVVHEAGRITSSGHGPATELVGRVARAVSRNELPSLMKRCDDLARYCRHSASAVVRARWECCVTAAFVMAVMALAVPLGGWAEGLAASMIKLRGSALRLALLMIKDAVLGMLFTGGTDGIDQAFRGQFDVGELLGRVTEGALTGALMGGGRAGLPMAAERTTALAALARWSEAPGVRGVGTRYVLGGSIGTGAIWTAGGLTGHGWSLDELEHAAEAGFGMALTGTGAEVFGTARQRFRSRRHIDVPHDPAGGSPVVRYDRFPPGLRDVRMEGTSLATFTRLADRAEDHAAIRDMRQLLKADPHLPERLIAIAADSPGLAGNYHHNVRFGNLMMRLPLHEAGQMDVRILRESEVLHAIEPHLGDRASRLIYDGRNGLALHSFVEGRVLRDVAPPGTPVPAFVRSEVVEVFDRLTRIPWRHLPLPEHWPPDGDTVAVGREMAAHTAHVHESVRRRFAPVFDALRVPAEPLAPIFDLFDTLTARPAVLLHGDLHRGNIILADRPVRTGGRAVVIDWELALVGDPLFDLANHFHLMRYVEQDRAAVLRDWLDRMPPEFTRGWEADLAVYRRFLEVKSAIVDITRLREKAERGLVRVDGGSPEVIGLTRTLNAAGRVWGWREPLTPGDVAWALSEPG